MHHIMPDKCKLVLGVGSPLLDILAPVEESFEVALRALVDMPLEEGMFLAIHPELKLRDEWLRF